MEGSEMRMKFIELRAQGLPYRAICEKINISIGTCSKWNREFEQQILELKGDKLRELYSNYYMVKEARIEQLGETLKRISIALENKNLSELSADKLLDYKIKYIHELKDEFIDLDDDKSIQEMNAFVIMREFASLFKRVKAGNITTQQAVRESNALGSVLRAYEAAIIEKKLDEIKGIFK